MLMFPFTDDVVQFIVLLTQHGTAEKVRAAISQNAEVMRFAAPAGTTEAGGSALSEQLNETAAGVDDADASGKANSTVAQSGFFTSRVPFVAICEVSDDTDDAAGGSHIIATTDPASFFRSSSLLDDDSFEGGVLPASLRGAAAAATAVRRSPNRASGVTALKKAKALSCIMLERRDTAPGAAGLRPLSVRDLYVQSIDLQKPLGTLQGILQNIFDPMLRSHKTQSALRAQVQDLLTGISSMHHVLPEIDITRCVHEDLLKLCDANPKLDVPQLIDRLGESARDPSFIRRILQVRNKCNEALSMEALLSGKIEDEELAKKRQSTRSKEYGASAAANSVDVSGNAVTLSGTGAAGAGRLAGYSGAVGLSAVGCDSDVDDDSVWAVQERIVYWQCVAAWMEDMLKQLRGREWRLLHRLLAQRVEKDYVAEYVGYIKLVQEYIALLNTIPEKRLVNVRDMKELNAVADEILTAATRPTRFAPRLQLNLLTSLVSEIAWRWVSLMEAQPVLLLDEGAEENGDSAANGNINNSETSATSRVEGNTAADAAAAARRDVFDPLASLQTLRVAIHALRILQAKYVEHSKALRLNIRVVLNPRDRIEHPRVEALLQRCIVVRDFLEGHLLLMRQLGVVFSTQVRLPFAMPKSSMSAPQPGEEYALAMQEAYNEFVLAVCGLRSEAASLGLQGASRKISNSSNREANVANFALGDYQNRSNFLWLTTPPAAYRFNLALHAYQQRRDQCDEQIALLVSQLLSNQQHIPTDSRATLMSAGANPPTGQAKATAITNFADSRGLRVFRTYKSFKMLPLERVQRVLQGYQDTMAEKLSAYVTFIQESYVSVPLTKQEISCNTVRFGVSTLVAQIIWEKRLAEALSDAMVRFDYASEHGWHQLLYLRNVEHYWRLNATLADFIGVSLDLLVCDELRLDSEVHGCAVALACLNLHYAEEANEWGQDEYLHIAQELVETHDPGSLAVARDHMLVGGAPRLYKATARVRDIRSSRDIILQRIATHTTSWYEEVDKLVSGSSLDTQTMLLSGPVLWAVNCGPTGASYAASGGVAAADNDVHRVRDGCCNNNNISASSVMAGGTTNISISGGNLNNSTSFPPSLVASPSAFSSVRPRRRSISPSYRGSTPLPSGESLSNLPASAAAAATSMCVIEVAFPWNFPTIAEDLRYLEAAQLTPCVLKQPGGGGIMGEIALSSRSGTSNSSNNMLSLRGRGLTAAAGLAFLRDALRSNEVRARLALTLAELIRVYYITVNGEDAALVLLATDEYQEVNRMLQRGMMLRWNDDGLLTYVQQLSDTMQTFTTTVQQVRCKTDSVYKKIKAFHVRAFHPEAILQRVKALRRIVDALALRCVHAHLWTRQIHPLLEEALLTQMKYLMHSWTEDFQSMRGDARFLEKGTETDVFRLTPLRIRMRVVYKEVRLESPCSAWRQHWINELNRFLSWIDVVPRLYKQEEAQAEALALDPSEGAEASLGNLLSASRLGSMSSARPSTIDVYSSLNVAGGGSNPASPSGGGPQMDDINRGKAGSDGYQYLLMRLPASALAEPLQAIEHCVQEAIDTEKEWRRGQQFLNMDVGLMQQRFGGDLHRWSRALGLMHTVTSRIMDYTQPNKLLGGIVILSQEAQIELGRKLDQVSQYAHAKFKDLLQGEQEKVHQEIVQERTKIDALDVISNVRDAAAFLSAAPGLKAKLQRADVDITLMSDAEANLAKLGHVFPEHWTYAAAVREEYTFLAELVDRKLKTVQVRRPYLLEEARTTTDALETKIKELASRFHNLDSDTATKDAPAAAKQMVESIFDEAKALDEEAGRITAIQEALGEMPHSFSSLQKLLEDVSRVNDVWSHVASAYEELNELGAMPFFEMVPRRLHERLQAIEEKAEHYPEVVKGYQLCKDLISKLRSVMSYNRLMQDLRSDAMSPLERSLRHWTALQQKLHAPWVLENIRVRDIWTSDPAANATIYHEVIEMAQGERRIEVQLHNITNYWNMFEFSVIAYKKQVALIRGWDEVLDRLTEDLSTFGGMRASPYFISPQLVAMTNEAEARLDRLRQVLETLLEVQKRWVYLDGIFAGNTEVRAQLPHDTVKFDRTSRELLHILPRPRSSGELPEVRASFFLEDEKLQATLERLLSQLTAVQRALTSYLDTQRSRFPRFFFVGDDDLLEIMGNSKNPLFLNKHLKKMFTALSSFLLDGNVEDVTTRLRGFSSSEGEELTFQPGAVAFRQRPMHEWLGEAEQGVAYTLRESTLRTYKELQKDHTHYAPLWSMDWIRRKPAQVVCLALQLIWTRQQEDLLDAAHKPNANVSAVSAATNTAVETVSAKSAATASSAVTKSMDELLVKLAGSVLDHSIEPSTRYRCEQLITIAVYQRDVSRSLAARKVASSSDFDWLSVLRLYVVPANQRSAGNNRSVASVHSLYQSAEAVECRMAEAAVYHGFEYVGAYERLVQTPLTDKCYLTLMQALHTRFGGSPIGPAGTGKTETVKALGMQLGRHVLVFNCDDTFDYQAVSRIFLGLCQVGAWGCFDEFNRLEERILSALSLQIQVIQQSLRERRPQVQLNHRAVPLHNNVAIFITMNPGYAGRSKLPGNLKQLFRTVTMTIPDRETIAEVMLFAQGFTTAEVLSQKVVPLFRLCEEQFTHQAHYDFGLRALKSVLVAAGDRKRQVMAETRGRAVQTSAEVVQEEERTMLLESVIATIAPKLVTQDVGLFYLLLRDFFPGQSLPTLPMEALRESVAFVCAESGLAPAHEWVEKVLQLYHTKLTRHGVMLVGPSGTGKTTAWKVLMAAMVRLEKSLQMHAYVISPKVLSKGELFGTLDITTREWRDGVLTSILRRIVDAEEQQQIPDDMAFVGNEEKSNASHADLGFSTNVDRPLFVDGEGSGVANNKQHASTSAKTGTTPPAKKTALGGSEGEEIVAADVVKEHWIIFDGDVDPEWVENLNSVLDDNRLLTLPNGERLPLPRSVRILFEVQNLRYATPATVSRCGMLWFSDGIVPLSGVLSYTYHHLQELPIVDARGRHLHWNTDGEMIGVAGPRRFLTSDCVLSGSYGKVYHELVISNTTQHVLDDVVSTPLPLRHTTHSNNTSDTDNATLSRSAVTPRSGLATKEASPKKGMEGGNAELDLGSTLYGSTTYGAASIYGATFSGKNTHCRSHPDAERIQEIMVNVWREAFERNGAIARGLQLVKSATFRDVCVMELNDLEVIQSILSFLTNGVWRTFEAEQRNNGDVFDTNVIMKIGKQVLSYAIFWGLSSSMNLENRTKFAKELELRPIVDGVLQSMVEVEVNYSTGEWQLIRNRVHETSILAEQVGANDTVITTVDTCRHEDVLSAWLGSGRSAILCGPPGSGKTMSITAVLNSLPEYEVVFLNFSSGTTITTIMKALEQYCTVHDTVRGLVMVPTSGKQLLLFCDEINLPALDHYGTQVVVQLLRQLIERKGFFRSRDNVWINVEDVQVVGACNPPTDPGRVPLSPRFLRWAPVLHVDFPSPESLLTIYTTYCNAILAWNERLCGQVATRLAKAMVKMYRVSQAKFTPIQQPHYLYSPRELSRWSRALYEGILTWDDSVKRKLTVSQLVRLALHEGLRVFSDRLVTAEEGDWTDAAIDDCFREYFDEVDPHTFDRPLLFSTLLSRSYTDSPRETLRAYVQKRLAAFNEEEAVGDLVIYDNMIDHVVRIDRVLRQPLGHLLIVGSSGVGKTVLTKLVAWMRGFTTFTLMVHRNYDLDDFENDLRAVLRRSGCKRERICFLFDESNILQPSFLEYMNALLASGEVPGLFDGDEWSKLMQELREAVLLNQSYYATSRKACGKGSSEAMNSGGSGGREGFAVERSSTGRKNADAALADGNADTDLLAATLAATTTGANLGMSKNPADDLVDVANEAELYHWFLTNIREYLHVVLTINPSSGEFTSRTVASPALVNRCTIDWFGDWELPTLRQVSQERIRSLTLLPVCHDVFSSESEAKDAVVESLCMMHQATQSINHALRVRHANQGSFITPRHFTDCVSHFVSVFNEKQKVSSDSLVHLRNGLTKLQQTSQEVSAQQAALRESEAELEASSQRAQQMLERIVTETDMTKREKAAAEALERQLQDEHAQISDDAKRMSIELAEAEPALKEADAALSTVKPEYLREIRAYTMPPPMVKRTLEAVCVLMGERNSSDWETLKNQIRRDDFLTSVRTFRPDDISEAAREQVRIMMRDTKFTIEAAYRASKAAGPLMQWIFFQVKYSAIYQRVAPMRTQIEALIKARDIKLKGLGEAQQEVRLKEASLQQLMAEYQNATAQIGELKRRIETVGAKCDRAQTILRRLLDERDRWQAEVKSSDSEARTTLGACIMSAVFLTYTGFYDEYTRERVLIPRWLKCLRTTAIPVREGLSVTEYLSSAAQQLSWEEGGLPKDRLAIDNAAIMHRCLRYVLLIDPTGVAAQFVLRFYAMKKITKASFSRPGYAKQLEMAVRFGYPILMEDAEHLDPAVSPLLNGEVRCHGTRYITRIGPHEVDLAPSFRLFLHTRNPNFQPPPDLAGQVCIVNFTVTLSSLQSQCLHSVLQHERSDVEEKRSKLLKTQGEYQLRLRVLEDKLLTRIAESEGSLLDNDALIKSLEELKQEAMRIARDIEDSEDSLREIRLVEEQYRPIATAVAQAHFALQRFGELNPYYHYDVGFVLRVLDDALGMLTPPTAPALPADEVERLHTLTYLIFALLHRRGVRGMFNEDHLVWALRLAQLRSAMGTIGTGRAVGNGAAAVDENPATGASTSTVSPEEWEWILSCLRVTRTGGSDATTTNGSGTSASEDFVALPPVVRRACPTLGSQSRQALAFQLAKPAFKELRLSFTMQATAWESILTSAAPLSASEQLLSDDCFPRGISHVRRLLLITVVLLNVRRDAFSEAARKLLSAYFSAKEMHASAKVVVGGGRVSGTAGSSLLDEDFFAPQTNDLAEDVMPELSEATPLLMVADTMFDPASRVEELARRINTTLYVVAMGSMESIESADSYLAQTTKEGGWLLLKNVHLALGYMDKLEKQLHFQRSEQQLHKGFRLFLTAERDAVSSRAAATAATSSSSTESKILPVNLIETSVMVVYEAPPGMQSSLLQTYGEYPSSSPSATTDPASVAAVSADASNKCSTALQRLYLAAAWLHSVITERISYKPLGWCEAYEFTEVEYQRVVQAVQAWSSTKTGALTVSWDALRSIVSTTVYGGKVSNVFDQHVLDTFCRRLLSTDVLRDGAQLVPKTVTDASSSSPLLPITGRTHSELLQWVRGLEGGNSDPAWLALPASADRMTRARSAIVTVERLSLVQSTLDDELTFVDDVDDCIVAGSTSEISGVPLKLMKGGAGTAAPGPAVAGALRATRWAAKVQSYCVAWYPPLQSLLQKLQEDTFVEQAVTLHEQESRESSDIHPSSADAAGNSSSASNSTVSLPLVLAMQREVVAVVELMRHLVTDIHELREVVMEERTPSSVHRSLVEDLMKDHVPAAWAAHLADVHGSVAHSLFVGLWIADVQQRAEHLLELASATSSGLIAKTPVRLGLLFSPGAFLTAFKQQCARTDRVPLERLVPQIEVAATPASRTSASGTGAASDLVPRSANEMVFLGLTLYSAVVGSSGKCALTSSTKLNGDAGLPVLSTTVALRWKWVRNSNSSSAGESGSTTSLIVRLSQQRDQQSSILLPMYTTENRESLLEVLDVSIAPDRTTAELGVNAWYERGACFAAWTVSD